MKQLLNKYASYNLWAHKLLLDRMLGLPDEIVHKETGTSFGSMYKTYLHMMEVESIWWQRLKLQEHIVLPEKDPEENTRQLADQMLALSRQWIEWVSKAKDNNLTHVFGYYNSKRVFFKQPVYEMLMHVFNHQTYHRGQIVSMMRQNGIDKIPATDFIAFCRKSR